MEAIILAGGLGTRLKSTVPDVPKPMAPINGRPFLEYQMEYWIAQGVHRFILSIGYKSDIIQNHFGDHFHDAELIYAVEDLPLGTGGGLLLAMGQLGQSSPFLVVNGDTFFEVDLEEMQRFHARAGAELTIALRETENDCRYGDVQVDTASRVTEFMSRPTKAVRSLINGGIYLMEKSVFHDMDWSIGQACSLEGQMLTGFLEAGRRLFGFQSSGQFIDIGIPEDYFRAAGILDNTKLE